MRAVLSVSDKRGLVEFAQGLASLGCTLFSTGGTQSVLEGAGVPVSSVATLTGFPEILDGRVKTLHPKLHGGILARRDDKSHIAQLAEHQIGLIDLVVVNLYPFVETIASCPVPFGVLQGDSSLPDDVQDAVEQIDIGGPTLARAAAKNFEHVIVVVDPADYQAVLDALRAGRVPLSMRASLAQKAFQHTAQYDAYVAQYFAAINGVRFADALSLPLSKVQAMSYGENPHQEAAFYRFADPRLAGSSLADFQQLHGDAPSYNNLLDLDNAYAIVAEFDEPAVAIVKHNNPCGVGIGDTITEAYHKAYSGDPLSAFGGVVAANRPVDAEMAEAMAGVLYWVLVAPDYTDEAVRIFTRRRRDGRPMRSTRVFKLPVPARVPSSGGLPAFQLHYRQVAGGFLVQTPDVVPLVDVTLKTVSKRPPTQQELADLRFAWRIVKHVRSNAVVYARDGAVLGVGAGQMSRVDAVVVATHVARRSAEERLRQQAECRNEQPLQPEGEGAGAPSQPESERAGPPAPSVERPADGAAMATDGFFPFPDAVEEAAKAGATAIVHPGGARQDEAAIAMADHYGLAMVVTGYRHFRH